MLRNSTIIISIVAQEDNLGDIEIRDALLENLTATNHEILALRGKMSNSYVEAFHNIEKCTWYSSPTLIQLALIGRVLRGNRVHFFISPGPSNFSSKPSAVFKSLINYCNMRLARISGGSAHIVGRAYRGQGITKLIEIAALKICASSSVRDAISKRCVSGNSQVLPDLAFFREASTSEHRKYVAISVRESEDLCEKNFESLIVAIRATHWTPILVTQVKRDNAWMQRIADQFNVDILQWKEESHKEQRKRIGEMYLQSRAVISNRLHGLIMGAIAGAQPIPLITKGNTKLLPTLSVVFQSIAEISSSDLNATNDTIFSKTLESWDSLKQRNELQIANQALREHFDLIKKSI